MASAKDTYRRNAVTLQTDLQVDPLLLAVMIESDVFKHETAYTIWEDSDRTSCFLERVSSRGERGLKAFIYGLVKTSQRLLADALHEDFAKEAAQLKDYSERKGASNTKSKHSHKELCDDNMVKLIQELDVDSILLARMIQFGHFAEGNRKELMAKQGYNKTFYFVHLLRSRGEEALNTFFTGLVETSQHELALRLDKQRAEKAGATLDPDHPEGAHAQETHPLCELEFEMETYLATFEVTARIIRKKNLAGEVTIQYKTKNGTAKGGETFGPGVDFESQSEELTFKDGEDSKEITISVDEDVHEKKVFSIVLSSSNSEATLGENSVTTVIITGEIILDVSCQPVGEQKAKELLKQRGVYPMDHRPRGLAVIINNITFEKNTELKDRDGASFDQDHLTKLFEQLHFDCTQTTKTNQTAEQMKTFFDKLSKENHQNYDALFVCVMSHGTGYSSIYGTDGETIDFQKEIIQPFYKTAYLKGKPKIFLFQACRQEKSSTVTESSGNESRPPGPAVAGESSTEAESSSNASQPSGPEDQGKSPAQPMNTGEKSGNKIEDSQNILRISSSVPGTVSHIENSGSWFIRSFVKVTEKYAHLEDLKSIMDRVRELMDRKPANEHLGKEYHERQCPEIADSGFKKLYLLPGYPPK